MCSSEKIEEWNVDSLSACQCRNGTASAVNGSVFFSLAREGNVVKGAKRMCNLLHYVVW